VLKLTEQLVHRDSRIRPPSGGCVLKPLESLERVSTADKPAAFGRLCVETSPAYIGTTVTDNRPPSGGCVLKPAREQATAS